MPEFDLPAGRPTLARLLGVAAIVLLPTFLSAQLVSHAIACDIDPCGDGGDNIPPITPDDTPPTDPPGPPPTPPTPPDVPVIPTPPAPQTNSSSGSTGGSSEAPTPAKVPIVPMAVMKFEAELMPISVDVDEVIGDIGRASPLALALVEAGGDRRYLEPVMGGILEGLVQYPDSFIVAGRLASVVGTNDFSDTLEKYYAAYDGDDRAIKQRMDEILSSLKTMLNFGVSVGVFLKTHDAMQKFLESKGNTFHRYSMVVPAS